MPDQLHQYRLLSKILLVTTFLMIGSMMLFFIIYSYHRNLSTAEEAALHSLSSIVKTLALQIDGDIHQTLVCSELEKDAILENGENQNYEQIFQVLNKAQLANNLKTPIYTLFKHKVCSASPSSEKTLLFGVSSNSPYFRHAYEHVPETLFQNFDEGGTVGDYEDENGHWLSAFHPIKNSDGKTIALLQADQSFSSFIAAAKTELYSEGIFAFSILSLIVGIFVFAYRKILRSMSDINLTLEEAVMERTKKINQSNLELNRLNERLEKIVEERTQEVKVSNQQLLLSNEKLKSFAHVASHDLQAPIRIVKSFGDLLKRNYGEVIGEEGNEFLNFIISNAQKMSDLVKEILNTSLLPSENTMTITNVDLNKVIVDVKENLKYQMEQSQAQINYNNLPAIAGFRSDFIQLFQNLISNSIKYSRTNVIPKINIDIMENDEDYFIIKIIDNGRGISKEALSTILVEFDRGDAADNDGYGIGLATCQRILKGYSGTLQVTSELGVGTCFAMALKGKSNTIENHADAIEVALGEPLKN